MSDGAEERGLVLSTVALPVAVDEAIAQWQEYQELTKRLLDPSDYQAIGNRRFKKKSAWRKYARAFNIADEVVYEQIDRLPDGWPRYARVRVRATAPNGRSAEADHEAHLQERCCVAAWGEECRDGGKWHEHCAEGCSGRRHWGHPGDVPATATTRAKNRAISDLIGAGEVSAEETDEREAERSHDAPAASGKAARPSRSAPPKGRQPAGSVQPTNAEIGAALTARGMGLRDVAEALGVPEEGRTNETIVAAMLLDLAAKPGRTLDQLLADVTDWHMRAGLPDDSGAAQEALPV